MAHIRTRQNAPALKVDLVGGGRWSLTEQRPQAFTMVVVYRGLHCPICRGYLSDLERKLDDFRSRGVEPIAISADTADRAATTKAEWRLEHLPIGHGLPIETARSWGLFISRSIKEGEPDEFAEPGLFLVKPDGTLYFAAINSAPFSRPDFAGLLKTIDFVLEKDYPARGEAKAAKGTDQTDDSGRCGQLPSVIPRLDRGIQTSGPGAPPRTRSGPRDRAAG